MADLETLLEFGEDASDDVSAAAKSLQSAIETLEFAICSAKRATTSGTSQDQFRCRWNRKQRLVGNADAYVYPMG